MRRARVKVDVKREEPPPVFVPARTAVIYDASHLQKISEKFAHYFVVSGAGPTAKINLSAEPFKFRRFAIRMYDAERKRFICYMSAEQLASNLHSAMPPSTPPNLTA